MLKFSILITVLLFTALSFGCSSVTPANSATNAMANANAAVKIDPANMPAGLSTAPVQPSGNSTPGIPPVIANLPKGATPTPGIPDPATLKKPMKPGVTPTPGIPDAATLRKAMGQPPTNVNAPLPSGNQMTIKKDANKLPKKPQ